MVASGRSNGGAKHAGGPPSPALKSAVGLHSAGRLAEAETAYREILLAEPAQFDALHLLGVLQAQKGAHEESVRLIGEALALNAQSAPAWNNYANALRQLQRLDEAIAAYDRAIEISPDHVEAHNNRGIVLVESGRIAEGLAGIEHALRLKPDHASAFFNRANVVQKMGQSVDALADFDRAIALRPDYAEAYNNRGTVLRSLGRFDEALLSYARAAQLRPYDAAIVFNHAAALHDSGRLEEALSSYEQALTFAPHESRILRARGNALYDLRRFTEALNSYDRANAYDPADAENHNVRANALKALNRYDEALAAYDQSLALQPANAKVHHNRGILLENIGQVVDALAACDTAVLIDPNSAEALGQAFLLANTLCNWHDLDARREAMQRAVRDGLPVPPYAVMTMADDPALQAQAAANYVAAYFPARKAMTKATNARANHSRRRVAYVSADFFTHATAHLAAGLFEVHDRNAFEIYGVSIGSNDSSPMRHRLEAGFDRFIDATAKPDHEIARLLAALDVDIVVDMKGHTRDARPGIFAHRPAPLAVSWLGYPGTMGASFIDYLLADQTVIPKSAEHHFQEKIVWLPGSYQVNDASRAISAENPTRSAFGLPDNDFVFCSFNNPYKLTPEVFDTWLDILRDTPSSVLWLYAAHPIARENLSARASEKGVARQRLIFADFETDQPRHLARLKLADLVLDTLPYNAHTTASDALWAGVPVLTLPGEAFPARVAASVLHAAGLPQLITKTPDEYRAAAGRLAQNPAELAAIKSALAQNRDHCALFDTRFFCAQMERAYTMMWNRHKAGLAPESFALND